MKLLRNPIVVGVLAAAAGVYMFWTIFGKSIQRSRQARQAAPPAATQPALPAPPAPLAPLAPAAAALPAPPTPARTPAHTSSARPIQFATIASQVLQWIEAPRRDPFRIDPPAGDVVSGPTASELLSLRAIWRQTGSQLAILNNQILREGDQVLGFRIETIEADSVWVRGTNGRERVSFPSSALLTVLQAASQSDDARPYRGEPLRETITATLPIAPSQ